MKTPPTSSKTEWQLTAEAFARLLAQFDPEPELAGIKYEALRHKLMKFFDWRGAFFPEECADETFDRIARKIEQGEEIQEIVSYCHGVARLVLLEELKSPNHKRTDFESLPPLMVVPAELTGTHERRDCFEHCLEQLSSDHRQLILQYYQDDRRDKIDNRLALATTYGIPLNALRSRAQRIRHKLEECVQNCLEQNAT